MARHGTSLQSQAPTAPSPIILYDVPLRTSPLPHPWTPNVWPVRFILNYKNLPYRTHWVEYQDVERTLREINAPPSLYRDGRSVYTLPVIVDPMRSATLSDPRKIAIYLENAYPARPVFPDGSRAVQILFAHYVQHVFTRPLLPIMVPMSHHRLPELDQQFLRPSTSSSADRVMPSYAAGPQRDAAWAAVKEQFDFLAKILDENLDAGSVVQGHQVTYADFVLCSVLMWIEKVAPRDGWQLVRQWNNGRWANVWDACRPHMEVR